MMAIVMEHQMGPTTACETSVERGTMTRHQKKKKMAFVTASLMISVMENSRAHWKVPMKILEMPMMAQVKAGLVEDWLELRKESEIEYQWVFVD